MKLQTLGAWSIQETGSSPSKGFTRIDTRSAIVTKFILLLAS